MTLDDTVRWALRNYPSLFWNRSAVLHHLFCVNGNGYDWHRGELVSAETGYERPESEIFRSEETERARIEAMFRDGESRERMLARMPDDVRKHNARMRAVRDDVEALVADRRVSFDLKLYPLCRYAEIMHVPDDVRPDWLDAARDVILAVYDYHLADGEDDEERRSNLRFADKALRSIQARFGKQDADEPISFADHRRKEIARRRAAGLGVRDDGPPTAGRLWDAVGLIHDAARKGAPVPYATDAWTETRPERRSLTCADGLARIAVDDFRPRGFRIAVEGVASWRGFVFLRRGSDILDGRTVEDPLVCRMLAAVIDYARAFREAPSAEPEDTLTAIVEEAALRSAGSAGSARTAAEDPFDAFMRRIDRIAREFGRDGVSEAAPAHGVADVIRVRYDLEHFDDWDVIPLPADLAARLRDGDDVLAVAQEQIDRTHVEGTPRRRVVKAARMDELDGPRGPRM